jgi:hypothetical protein
MKRVKTLNPQNSKKFLSLRLKKQPVSHLDIKHNTTLDYGILIRPPALFFDF